MAIGWVTEVWEETLLLMAFTWMYNDLGGSDENWILRNALIAVGYGLYSSAALRIMTGPLHTVTLRGNYWICIITVMMFVTQHICDIKDAEGDKLRGRKSAPIVLGDEHVRWSVAIPILLCSLLCPWFFDTDVVSYSATFGMGALVAYRTLMYRDLKSDKVTWKLWALWTCGIFALPLVDNPAVFARVWLEARTSLCEMKDLLCSGDDCYLTLDLNAVLCVTTVVGSEALPAQVFPTPINSTMKMPRSFMES